MRAPEEFAIWLTAHEHKDPIFGWVYHYHPRSDAHSVALCTLRTATGRLGRQSRLWHQYEAHVSQWQAKNAGSSNRNDKGGKTSDAICGGYFPRRDRTCADLEAKTVMTEHGKSQPRVFDELGSSHEIVHQGDREAIAVGVTVVNIATTFVSPLRQQKRRKLNVSQHKQPHAADRMIEHLRGLPIRDSIDGVGFDAYAKIVVDCDNQGPATLWTNPPAPQPGERDHYATFVERVARAYSIRFGTSQ
jgi:hypothetical protein